MKKSYIKKQQLKNISERISFKNLAFCIIVYLMILGISTPNTANAIKTDMTNNQKPTQQLTTKSSSTTQNPIQQPSKSQEEIMPKSKIDILRGAHKRARNRGDNPKKNNKKPKLAQLLERDAGIIPHLSSNERIYPLKTPFGKTWIKISKNGNNENINRLVYDFDPKDDEIDPPSYLDIACCLDDYYKKAKKESTLKMLKTILNYLNTPAKQHDTINNVWNTVNFDNMRIKFKKSDEIMPNAKIYERSYAAALCGTLMACESAEYRSENGGKRERGVIKTLIKMVEEEKSEHPFGDAFGRIDEKGNYIEGFYTPAAKGGTKRSQAVIGKISDKNETLEKDKRNTEYLDLSSDSEENN